MDNGKNHLISSAVLSSMVYYFWALSWGLFLLPSYRLSPFLSPSLTPTNSLCVWLDDRRSSPGVMQITLGLGFLACFTRGVGFLANPLVLGHFVTFGTAITSGLSSVISPNSFGNYVDTREIQRSDRVSSQASCISPKSAITPKNKVKLATPRASNVVR